MLITVFFFFKSKEYPFVEKGIFASVYELYFNAQSLFSLDFVWVISMKTLKF